MNTFHRKNIVYRATLIILSILLGACGSTATQTAIPQESQTTAQEATESTYVDSTLFIADETASVSMRAALNREDGATMDTGYKFQFRSINPEVIFLSSVSIIVGGDRIFLEEGQIALPKEKGITLQLSLDESLQIAQYESALFQFKLDNESFLMQITLHKLTEYLP